MESSGKNKSFVDDLFFDSRNYAVKSAQMTAIPAKDILQRNPDKSFTLLNTYGKATEATWLSKPKVESYVFFRYRNKLFTILGDEIQLGADTIEALLNFWVVYTQKGQMKIGRLVSTGTKFKIEYTLDIEDYGLLASKGTVVKQHGVWVPFKFLNGLVPDRKPSVSANFKNNLMMPLLKQGFTVSYLSALGQEAGVDLTVDHEDQIREWAEVNKFDTKILKSVSEILKKQYPIAQILVKLDISRSVLTVLQYYSRVKKVADLQ